ncbi:hypothetical protein PENTCL1PPCAC_13906, partial [Pristionchus entomophagus]
LSFLMKHAMTHCDEQKRFKCSRCPYTTSFNCEAARHITTRHNGRGTPIDRTNGLREALWKYLMYKCFPTIDSVVPSHKYTSPSLHARLLFCSCSFFRRQTISISSPISSASTPMPNSTMTTHGEL